MVAGIPDKKYKDYIMSVGPGGVTRRIITSDGRFKRKNGRIQKLNHFKEFDRKKGQFKKSLKGTLKKGPYKTKGRKGG